MKSNGQPSLYFSPHSPKALKQEQSAKTPVQSPYLRAVLSGKARTSSVRNTDSNLTAALRYINNSR